MARAKQRGAPEPGCSGLSALHGVKCAITVKDHHRPVRLAQEVLTGAAKLAEVLAGPDFKKHEGRLKVGRPAGSWRLACEGGILRL